MMTFKQYVLEKYNLGATAYGNADIDKTTAMEIQKGILKPSWQFLGNKNNKLTAGYSVANNVFPHGTIVKITDQNGNPVGAQFGNTEGIYKVEDTGGKNVSKNIDFYSGSNREMYNYFANLGKLNVTPINLQPHQERNIVSRLQQYQGGGAASLASSPTSDQEQKEEQPEEKNPIVAKLKRELSDLFAGGFDKEKAITALGSLVDKSWKSVLGASSKL